MSKIFGLRFDDRDYKVGEELLPSRIWEDGYLTDEVLNGTSALYISNEEDFMDYVTGKEEAGFHELDRLYREIKKAKYYGGEHVYIIATDFHYDCECGQDDNEIIMPYAEVVMEINLEDWTQRIAA